jgi:hypothetical protein
MQIAYGQTSGEGSPRKPFREDYAKDRTVSAVQLELESGTRWLREFFIHQNQTGKENSHQSQRNELGGRFLGMNDDGV